MVTCKTEGRGINSSKVYCKYFRLSKCKEIGKVLIVAKCIVNVRGKFFHGILFKY